jgi:hypothetical protein
MTTARRADSANGERINNPTEDDIYMVIDDLNGTDNAYVIIQPDEEDAVWSVSVTRLGPYGDYEIVRHDTRSHEHNVTTTKTIRGIAEDVIQWLEGRSRPEPTG